MANDGIDALHQRAVNLLKEAGAPMTTENLNRAITELSSGGKVGLNPPPGNAAPDTGVGQVQESSLDDMIASFVAESDGNEGPSQDQMSRVGPERGSQPTREQMSRVGTEQSTTQGGGAQPNRADMPAPQQQQTMQSGQPTVQDVTGSTLPEIQQATSPMNQLQQLIQEIINSAQASQPAQAAPRGPGGSAR